MHRTITTQAILLTLCFGYFIASGRNLEAERQATPNPYANCDYGYMVAIPTGLTARIPEYFSHGFEMDLPDRKSRIEIYNAYNMSDSSVPSTVFSYELQLRKGDRKNWRIVNQRSSREHNLDSIQVTASYARDGSAWKSEILIMYRPKQADGLGDIVYVVELSGPAARYNEAISYFNQTVEGISLTELPRGACTNK